MGRAARLAVLPAAHVGRSAVGLGMRVGGSPVEAVSAQVQQCTAEQLFATLGELKGGAMKVGQALSAMEAALPEAMARPYRDALVRLQEAAPAMPATMVHAQLDASFPGGSRRLFREFHELPVAAASVGQVHRAVMADGTPAAVKIQYPARAMRSYRRQHARSARAGPARGDARAGRQALGAAVAVDAEARAGVPGYA